MEIPKKLVMASINQNPSHVAKIGYNGFDMSNLLKFSSTTGELLPVYYDILYPGDKVSLDTVIQTRTMELESAAMCSLKEHLEWFFVPLNQIYSIFGDWFNGIQDFKSSLFDIASAGNVIPSWTASNFNTLLKYLQRQNDNYFESHVSDPTEDDRNLPLVGTSFRLLELLGIPIHDYANAHNVDVSEIPTFLMGCSPILACAYQKIYFDFYRLSDREPNDPSYYNIDSFYDESTIQGTLGKMFTLRYRPWKRDFFTNLFTSPLMGSTSIGSFGNAHGASQVQLFNAFQNYLNGGTFYTYNPSQEADTVNPTQVSAFTTQNYIANISPSAIRTSFAIQKLLEITRRAGKHYDAQTLAHFGVNVPVGIAGEVQYIGGSVSNIAIGDVISTAGTESDPLGKVAGKGYGQARGKKLKFEAKCHGVLMCIYSCEPEADYSALMYDKLNTYIRPADWPRPEYDNLGMQPLFGYQAYLTTRVADTSFNSLVKGWQYRWSELKCKQNKVCGSLMRSMSYWTPQRQLSPASTSVSSFLIPPTYLDPIMLVPYQFNAGSVESDESVMGYDEIFNCDPLIHQLYFDVKKSAKMSVYGLESL